MHKEGSLLQKLTEKAIKLPLVCFKMEDIFAEKPLHGPRIKKYIFTEKDFFVCKNGPRN